jgi:hypothetical protein
MFELPTESDNPRYSFSIELDGSEFKVRLEWNDRASAWFLDLSDGAGALLVSSRRVTVGFPLLSRFRIAVMPLGDLSAIDTSGLGVDPGYSDLGARVRLVYTPVAELPAGAVVSA